MNFDLERREIKLCSYQKQELWFMGNDDAACQEVSSDWKLLPADREEKPSHHG